MVNEKNALPSASVLAEFSKVFDLGEVKFKPAQVRNGKALALAYIDARLVMDRLDAVVGIDGWQDQYTVLPTGEVECRLAVRIADQWVTKADVGGQSEQPDEGDRMKAAYSDALKRAAVKFGIGRFLYRVKNAWQDYDTAKRGFAQKLTLTPDLQIVPAPKTVSRATKPARAADNLPARAKLAQAYGQVKNHSGYQQAHAGVVAARDKGELSNADITALKQIDADTLAKFPANTTK